MSIFIAGAKYTFIFYFKDRTEAIHFDFNCIKNLPGPESVLPGIVSSRKCKALVKVELSTLDVYNLFSSLRWFPTKLYFCSHTF